MSEHCGYIVQVNKLRPHGNADRLQIADFFGNETCVSLDVAIGDKGIYFPTDLQLSTAFCEANNLVRKKDEAGNEIGGFLDPVKRNVKTIRLRGEPSDGIYLPIAALAFTGADLNSLQIGEQITIVNGVEICQKYIPRSKNPSGGTAAGNKTRKKKVPVAPLFLEHADTEQLAYHLSAFKPGDEIEITLKMHGTSGRTGYLPVLKGYKRSLLDKILRRQGEPIYDWGYVSGTRRVVLDNYEGGFYGDNSFREKYSKAFEGKLHKGETVYYEIVGFTDSGVPIMGDADNRKLHDKEFLKQYGDTTRFSYGCTLGESDVYVYRMTMTNEDGVVVEYTPDFMRYRCEQMGVKTVSVFWKGFAEETIDWNDAGMTTGEWIMNKAEQYYDGPDPVGKTHVREGVVVRIVNRPKFTAYKHKNFAFKCLSGIAIDSIIPENFSEDILAEM